MNIQTEAPSYVQGARWAVLTVFFSNGFIFASWVPHIPMVQQKIGLSEGELGLVLLAAAAGALLSMPLAGWLSGQIGSGAVTLGTGILYCIALPCLLLAPSHLVLVIALFCFGACNGAMDVAMNAQGVGVERLRNQPTMSSLHGLWSVGGLAGAGAAGLLLFMGVDPVRHVIGVGVVFMVVLVVTSRFLLSRQAEVVEPVEASAEVGLGERLAALANGTLLTLGGLSFCVMVAEGAMADWSAVYLREYLGAGPGLAAIGFAAYASMMAIGRLTGDRIVRQMSRVTVIRVGSLAAAAGLALAAFGSTPWVAIAGFGLVGLGVSNAIPLFLSASGQVPGVPSGRAVATVTTVGYLGFLVGPPLIGFIAEATSLATALAAGALALLLVAALAHVVRQSSVRQSSS